MAGLVCAKELARRGRSDFLLLEAEEEPGGRVRSRRTAEGFVLDRGFQVLLDSYPAARRHLDIPALEPCYFESGAILHDGRKSWTVAHPLRHPADAPEGAFGKGLAFAVSPLPRVDSEERAGILGRAEPAFAPDLRVLRSVLGRPGGTMSPLGISRPESAAR